MALKTRNQRYAGSIYDQVQSVPAEQRGEYEGMAQKLPILIRTAGLAQALAFAQTRGQAAQRLLDDLANVVEAGTGEGLLSRSRQDQLPKYMRLTQEVLTALLWYKRFAQDSSTPTLDSLGTAADPPAQGVKK